jgi:RHS repeat-associated protein
MTIPNRKLKLGFAGTKSKPGFDYDENSALKMIKTDNGVTTTIPDIGGRDTNGRIKTMTVTKKNGDPILSLSYDYDKANNIIRRNDNVYTYDELNRLDKAIVYGAFQDKFTKADMRMGTVNQDYDGSKDQEEDVTDQTQIKIDYSTRSLIFNLQTDAENVSKIELASEATGHRVPVEQIEIYYKQRENDFAFSKLERSAWVGARDEQGRITIRFKPVLNAHLLKIHCNYDDLDLLQMPVDKSEFYNNPERLVTVYQKLISRTESYVYDAMGNRTTEKILLRKEYGYTYTYYPNSNRLKSKVKDDGTEKNEYVYDEDGNLISKIVTQGDKVDTWEYSYDLLNQLEQVKKNSVVVSSYVYDPNGFRVEKDGSQGRIDYVPLLNGEVGYRKEFSHNKEYSFIYTGGQHLARVNGVIGGSGKKFYYHNDHQGSALAVTDELGNKVVERDFAPFGERINTDIYDETERDVDEDDSGFTGKDWDQDVELYYYNARWYDSEIGRFTTEDSVADDPNLYGYCGQNPVNMTDPTGHFAIGWQSGAGLVGATINAMALLTGDENLSAAASVFGLFVAIDSYQKVKQAENNAQLAKLGKALEEERASATNETTETATSQDSSPSGDDSTSGSPGATQPPSAEEPPKTTEETITELEPKVDLSVNEGPELYNINEELYHNSALYKWEVDLIAKINVIDVEKFSWDIKNFKKIYNKNKAIYEEISKKTGLPPELIATIHYRESGCDFKTYLHNGDPLGKPTTHVPVGKNFNNFIDAAVDALSDKNSLRIKYKLTSDSKDMAAMMAFAESYNGLGYYKNGRVSAYVYSGTNIYETGKYVSDGRFDLAVIDRQPGIYMLINSLKE